MAWFTYQIVPGWNNSGTTINFETYFTVPLRGQRVPRGSVTRTTLDRKRHTNGRRPVELTTEGCTFGELDAYVAAVFGSWEPTNESADVTLRHRKADNSFDYFNAIAHLPLDGENYTHERTDVVLEVRLEFDIIEDL